MKNIFEQLYLASRNFFTQHEPDFIYSAREKAFETFQKQGLPTLKDEYWRKTDWKKVAEGKTEIVKENHFDLPEKTGSYEFFLYNGKIFGKETWLTTPEGVMMGSIRQAFEKAPEILKKYLFRLANPKYRNFYPVNSMLFWDGLFVYVPKGVKFENTIKLNLITEGVDQHQIHSRHLIILEDQAEVTIVWKDLSQDKSGLFLTDVSEIFVGNEAQLNYYRYQNLNDQTGLINMIYSQAGEKAQLKGYIFELNGGMLRNEVYARMAGTQSDVHWQGFYLPHNRQHFDNRIFIEHDTVNAQSNQAFKGIIDDESTAVYNGYILVNRGAQQTNAYQQNSNLLLSRKAKASSQPFLEIYADDVSCSHGSTTGQVNDEAMFYLMQRGLSEQQARRMLLSAFLGDIIDTIEDEEIKEKTQNLSEKKLDNEKLEPVLETI